MIPELLLGSLLAGCGGAVGYLYLDHKKGKRAREAELADKVAAFKPALIQELRRGNLADFRLSAFAHDCEIPPAAAERVADEIYARLCKQAVADGVITDAERQRLDRVGVALEIDPERVRRIEQEVKDEAYRGAVAGVLADGVIEPDEVAHLEKLRRSLGITRDRAFRITETTSRDAYLALFRQVAHDGVIEPWEREELRRCREALAIGDEEASRTIRSVALDLFRECFAGVVQDGEVTPEEDLKLAWLQAETGLSDADLAPYWDRLAKVKSLAEIRRGALPSISTRKLLEGGEICHWDGPCTLGYETPTKQKFALGELIVTSKRVIFASPTKGLTFGPAKILDITRYSDALEIKVSAKQGTGSYFVHDPEELEAILVGVARRHKYLLSERFSSNQTRHIPDDVKREVWARDGGRCVRCGAADYLEFDHIIPHAKGGANTVKNVQILCRRCNGQKSDKI